MEIWEEIRNQPRASIQSLFDADPERVSGFSLENSGIYFDFSKTHLNDKLLQKFEKFANEQELPAHIHSLLSGDIVNPSEDRPAEHSAERGIGVDQSVENATLLRNRMKGLIAAIDAGALGEIKHVIHLGIGGSALGPELLLEALKIGDEQYDTTIVSNIDGTALEPLLERIDAGSTLLVIASKSFTTAETFLNAQSVMDWMTQEGVQDPFGKIIALTADPEKAVEWGVDESRILPFSES